MPDRRRRNAEATQLPVPDRDFERCRTIADGADLHCYEQATSKRPDRPQPSVAGTWRLVRTPNPAGGADAISIMQIADPSRSDLDLAGLMVRCGEATTEVLIMLVRPFPPKSHREVTIVSGSQPVEFTATAAPPGLMLLLPPQANALADGPWQDASELTIEVADEHAPIHGVVPLPGLPRHRSADCARMRFEIIRTTIRSGTRTRLTDNHRNVTRLCERSLRCKVQ